MLIPAPPPPCKALPTHLQLKCAPFWNGCENRIDSLPKSSLPPGRWRGELCTNVCAGFDARFMQAFGNVKQASEYACSCGDAAWAGAPNVCIPLVSEFLPETGFQRRGHQSNPGDGKIESLGNRNPSGHLKSRGRCGD